MVSEILKLPTVFVRLTEVRSFGELVTSQRRFCRGRRIAKGRQFCPKRPNRPNGRPKQLRSSRATTSLFSLHFDKFGRNLISRPLCFTSMRSVLTLEASLVFQLVHSAALLPFSEHYNLPLVWLVTD